jgi:hypothetical protein
MRFRSEDEVNAEVARRDAAAGYKLSILDLVAGVPRDRFRDTRTEFERVSQNAWSPIFDNSDDDSADSNPWRRDDIGQIKAAAGFATDAESRRAYFKRAEREVDEKEEREAALAADKASPERAAAIEYATNHWRSVAFDINQPLSAVILSEQMLAQAKEPGASLSALKTMSENAVEQQKSILAERRDRASQERLRATAAFDAANVEPTILHTRKRAGLHSGGRRSIKLVSMLLTAFSTLKGKNVQRTFRHPGLRSCQIQSPDRRESPFFTRRSRSLFDTAAIRAEQQRSE